MNKSDLASELRERQHALGQVDAELIDAISDDQIIESYITCSGCGKRQMTPNQLGIAIFMARDADGFFSVCNQIETGHTHA